MTINTWCQKRFDKQQIVSESRTATFQITPSEQFNFSQPDEWHKLIHRFKGFRDASGLSNKDEVHQVNTSVYCIGDAADDNLCLLNLSNDDKKVNVTVKEKFEQHFIKH